MIFFGLGLIVGSFLNVVIHRVPRGLSVVRPPSACTACGERIRWYDNIPLLSFALLRGRCRRCRRAISWQYPLVELATGLVFAAVAAGAPEPNRLVSDLVWISLLVVVTVVDLEHQIIPDVITLPGIAVGLAARILAGDSLLDGLLGLAVGGGTLLVTAWAYRRATGVDGMGVGDVKLMAMVGAYLGWGSALRVIFIASAAGAALGLLLVVFHRAGRRTALPFGTFLAPTSVAVLLIGPAGGRFLGGLPW
jgi:leader peptidase (prepilin peptidase)/N-methyltransferase